MNKTAIKNFAISARTKLIAMAIDKAGIIGITKDGASKVSSSGKDFAIFPTHFGKETRLEGTDIQQRQNLVNKIKQDGFDVAIEEVAYTWFNRIIAVRFMEVNNYLPTGVRVLSSETAGKFEPDIVTQAPEVGLDFTDAEKDEIYTLKDDPRKSGELFKKLFIKQCNALSKILPELFENTSFGSKDFTEILLDLSWDKEDGVVRELLAIEEADFLEAVEIIGWMYQYYNTELNEIVYDGNMAKSRIPKELLPAATTIYTPDWAIKYMLQNSLGRLWLEGHPDTALKADWKYYLDEAEQEERVKLELEKTRADYKNIKLEEIKLIDPCMGSGHILVRAFDMLMQIYLSCGYTKEDAVMGILQHNLYGLDIDKRAFQLTYFALNMKARSYDRRFLTHTVAPRVYVIEGSNNLNGYRLMGQLSLDDLHKADINYLIDAFQDAKEYGSILQLDRTIDYDALYDRVSEQQMDGQLDLETVTFDRQKTELLYIIALAKTLSQQYDVVVTNPPYMGKKSLNAKMSSFLDEHYDKGKSEMYAAFILQCMDLTKKHGFTSMITIHTWMFISSFEKLRNHILNASTISSMLHTGPATFEELSSFNALATSFVLRRGVIENYNGIYIRLTDFLNSNDKISNFDNNKVRYTLPQNEFGEIPGEPFVYWVSDNARNNFTVSKPARKYAEPRQGLATADNDRFVRNWFEVCLDKIAFNCSDGEETIERKVKWIPYNKGGNFRKWYGMNEYVLNWNNNGSELKNYKKAVLRNPNYYFKKGITWSLFGFENFGVRYKDSGFIFDVSGSSMFPSEDKMLYKLAFLASKVAFMYLSILAPTVNFQVGNIGDLPLIFDEKIKPTIDKRSKECIDISREDWDDFEESWDFKRHPLCGRKYSSINATYDAWVKLTENRYSILKANEEEINRLFINIYNVQDDISPEVVARDIALRRADLQRDIKSLISYAVGCMFGRYSLDVDGIAYAGGEFDSSKYSTFIPDRDNILPITDEDYFDDDIVSRFVEFVRVVYGDDTLEENLDFIAKALSNKGDSARQVIRNYFLKDFYKDHCKIYQKRPIYWLFDSGKEDGFKALCYLHRYDRDTVGRVRTDYLHKQQGFLENATQYCDYILSSSQSPRDKADATKRKDKLVKQLAETKLYDQAIGHIALQRIELDLDDGVKVNYEKFQGVEVAREGQKTLNIDLLGKI